MYGLNMTISMKVNRGHSPQFQLHRPWVWVAALTILKAALRAIGLNTGLRWDESLFVAKSGLGDT